MKFKIIDSNVKKDIKLMPFVTFPLTKVCNFRCQYCGHGGELSASMVESYDFDVLKDKIYQAHKLGVRKFRLTGGEPFTYPKIIDILKIFDEIGIYLHVNTNGSLIERYKHEIEKFGDNIHFAVSLDTLNPDMFDVISGTKGMFQKVMNGIDILEKSGHLLRVNMVVTKLNKDEIFDIIDFCNKKKCNIKLLDVVSVPLPFGDRKDLHVPFIELEKLLAEKAEKIYNHQYARSFGTPCKIYLYNEVRITVKSTWNGSRYDINGICKGCNYFPCHEGLYDIFALPDNRVVGCRWSEESVIEDGLSFENKLESISEIFQRADYIERKCNEAMPPNPDFVMNSLKRAKEIIVNI